MNVAVGVSLDQSKGPPGRGGATMKNQPRDGSARRPQQTASCHGIHSCVLLSQDSPLYFAIIPSAPSRLPDTAL